MLLTSLIDYRISSDGFECVDAGWNELVTCTRKHFSAHQLCKDVPFFSKLTSWLTWRWCSIWLCQVRGEFSELVRLLLKNMFIELNRLSNGCNTRSSAAYQMLINPWYNSPWLAPLRYLDPVNKSHDLLISSTVNQIFCKHSRNCHAYLGAMPASRSFRRDIMLPLLLLHTYI